jgi:hypothetical protein
MAAQAQYMHDQYLNIMHEETEIGPDGKLRKKKHLSGFDADLPLAA